jgi:hypothetical protein
MSAVPKPSDLIMIELMQGIYSDNNNLHLGSTQKNKGIKLN